MKIFIIILLVLLWACCGISALIMDFKNEKETEMNILRLLKHVFIFLLGPIVLIANLGKDKNEK